MLSKISSALVAFLAAASAVNALVVPQSLSDLDVTASTPTSLTLSVKVSLLAAPEDAGRSIDFTFGNADGSLAFGNGNIVLPAEIPADGLVTTVGSGTYSPATPEASAAGEQLLSNYAANLDSAISVNSPDGLFTNVVLSRPGTEVIQKVFLVISVQSFVQKRGFVQFQVLNPFSLPLTFNAVNATAAAPLAGGVQTVLGTINQNPLPITIIAAPKGETRSGNISAVIDLTLAQGLNLLSQLTNGRTINATTNADAAVQIGEYRSTVAIRNKIIPAALA